ncbi:MULTISPECIES: MFS transporter [Salinibaculum]|uniref:MFS transporter n=1 Tax=Salinibaculum TaxID=2732368 RepID=UPI0030CF686E
MQFTEFVRQRRWPTVVGYGLFVAVLAAGYYYNLTFVQLGLIDLGTRLVGLTRFQVSIGMAALALVAVVVALVTGVALDRYGLSTDLRAKLRVLWGVIVVQLALTLTAPVLASPAQFGGWIVLCAASIGVGMPTTFSLVVDLVPVADRGPVAAAATAAAYFLANVYPTQWEIESFSIIMSAAMAPAVLVLGYLAFRENALVDALAGTHERPSFGIGRFCRPNRVRTGSYAFLSALALMFGVYFIDSLGFLRIIETPAYIYTSWQSPDFGVHLLIGGVHVVTAVMAGVLYTNFGRRWLFLLVFGLFGFTHLMYVFDVRAGIGDAPLLMPLFYAGAVSFYTVLNFAIWPDMSTPETIGRHSAIGVGIAGFLATFLSTAVVLYIKSESVGLARHLTIVDALSLLFFFLVLVTVYAHRMVRLAHQRGEPS